MDNILSTLKGEYARTLILILIPGAIALEPFAIMIYKFQSLKIKDLHDYITLVSIIYVLAAIFVGFIIQDIASRLEIRLDKWYCKKNDLDIEKFYEQFDLYLFNEKKEDYIVTHYYRSMLVRMRFELHTCASITILLVGSLLRTFMETGFKIDWIKSIWFVLISLALLFYLLYESKEGVSLLHKFRRKVNDKFNKTVSN
jgi:hypothetical protein